MSNYEAFDRLSGVLSDIGKYKEQMRQREIDEHATSLLLQGDSDGAEKYLVEQMAPQQKGIAGFAQRLFGGGAPPELSPMQQQVIAKRMQGGLATPQQTADLDATKADTTARTNADRRADELHPLQKDLIRANTDRSNLAGDPQSQAFDNLSSVLNSYLRANDLGQYDTEIDALSGAVRQIADKITGARGAQSQDSPKARNQDGPKADPMMYSNLKTGELHVNGKGTGTVAKDFTPPSAGKNQVYREGQQVAYNGKTYRVVGFDVDGEPIVEEVK